MSSLPAIPAGFSSQLLQEAGGGGKKDDPQKIHDAAQQFEALLISQLMRQMREASGPEQSDQSSTSILEMAEQEFARVMSAGGGLGLAKLVIGGLSQGSRSEE
jgi:Rod binding domain-containing protein